MVSKNKALFIDRDGVINIEKGYVYKISDFQLVDGIYDVLNYFKNDYLIFIITNQSGIARKYYTVKDLEILNEWIINLFKNKNILIKKIYYCPHHPDFDVDCECRKPKTGMIRKASKEYNLDLEKSILIGNSETDIMAGINSGIKINIKTVTNDLSEIIKMINNNEI